MNMHTMEEKEAQDMSDPMSDPEEQRLMISVLDSFRYTPNCNSAHDIQSINLTQPPLTEAI